ncbi:MAG: type II toxin-antitoxin system VapC family toxin [Chloroflexi bacterium]|nr:type II toxin-antitoxin system VapC family toxin [Chloroflexota bacterium]
MKYLLDTNTCIQYINGRVPRLRETFRSKSFSDIVICSKTKAEMYFGSQKSQTPIRSRAVQDDFLQNFDSLPFDDAAAEEYGAIRAYLEKRGTPIGPHDMLLAAIARAKGLIIVTHNTREFMRVPGLNVEDWETG